MDRNQARASDDTSTSDVSHYQKYHGLLKRSRFKELRDNLFQYFDYINTTSSAHRYLITLFNVTFTLEYVLSSFYLLSPNLWPTNNLIGKVMQVFSIIPYICPSNMPPRVVVIIALIMDALILMLFSFYHLTLYVFRKLSKMPTSMTDLLSVLDQIGILSHIYNGAFLGRELDNLIRGIDIVANSIAFILGIIIFISLIGQEALFITSSIVFKPQVIHILYPKHVILFFSSVFLQSFLASFGSLQTGALKYVIMSLCIVSALLVFLMAFYQYLWGTIIMMFISRSISFISIILTIVLIVLEYKRISGNEIVIVVTLISLVLIYYLFQFFGDRIVMKSLNALDQFASGNEEIDLEIISYHQLLNLLRIGFDYGAKLCHSWYLFTWAFKKYPKDYYITLMYARYAAIYSEESTVLQLAYRRLKDIKHNRLEVKYFLYQVLMLLQHRERGLSKSLKKHLLKITDKTDKCRGQLRYAWECVIRGSIPELENLTIALKKNEDDIQRSYTQLCLLYPNNPYVMSSYSAFLIDITCNEKEAEEAQQVYRMLRSGTRTRTDRSYYFAIKHIVTLPTEEEHSTFSNSDKPAQSDSRSMASTANIGIVHDIDQNTELKAQKRYLETMIDSVRIPTSRYGPFIIIFAVSLVIPIIFLPIFIDVFTDFKTEQRSLKAIEACSLFPLYYSHVSFLVYQYVMSNYSNTFGSFVNSFPTLKTKYDKVYDTSIMPEYIDELPNFFIDNDCEALIKAIDMFQVQINVVSELMPVLADTGFFATPIDFYYSNRFTMDNYFSSNQTNISTCSLDHLITYSLLYAVQISYRNISDIFSFPGFWTLIRNSLTMTAQFEAFSDSLLDSYNDFINSKMKETEIIAYVTGLIGIILTVSLLAFVILKSEKEKDHLFLVFRALPKSAVSSIVQQLNAQSGKEKELTESHMITNAQEENAIRVLSTSITKNNGWIMRYIPLWTILLIFLICSISILVIFVTVPRNSSRELSSKIPLLFEIPKIHTQIMNMLIIMSRVSMYTEPSLRVYSDDYAKITNELESILRNIHCNMHSLRFGSDDHESLGVATVSQNLIDLLAEQHKETREVPIEDIQILQFSSYDTNVVFLHRMISSMLYEILYGEEGRYLHYDIDANKFNLLCIFLFDISYPMYVIPSIQELGERFDSHFNKVTNINVLLPVIFCVTIIIVSGVILVPFFNKIGDHARWVLRLLLFCEPSMILQNKTIVKILSNDFSECKSEDNEASEKDTFYETVVSHILDGVCFMTNDLKIVGMNPAFCSILNKKSDDLIGKYLSELFEAPHGKESPLRSFYQSVDGAMSNLRSPFIECEIEVIRDDIALPLQVTLTAISSHGEVQIKPTNSEALSIISLIIKDLRATVQSRTLLFQENKKNEELLSMILPPVIVKQLQRGEQNICFTVQSASVVFMDIVSFTPWCGSNTASYVMATLNRLFNEFDLILKKYDKMTKIKCIGDCYMCAGGIFDEVNQPKEHAKQAISFGIDAIQLVEVLDIELKENLKIRVGCNTGGPIVAGVLGIEKPTFDILGPEINLAAMMEHHGIPMHVHIPQHVYELVYGDEFIIKERGDVDVKGKTYHTYVVSDFEK